MVAEAQPSRSSPPVISSPNKRRSNETSPEAGPSRVRQRLNDASGLGEEDEEDDRRELQMEEIDEGESSHPRVRVYTDLCSDEEAADMLESILRTFGGNTANGGPSRLISASDLQRQRVQPYRPRLADPEGDRYHSEDEDQENVDDDFDDDEDRDDEDGDVQTDEDDMAHDEEDDEDEEDEYGSGNSLSDLGEFGNVEKIMPRMCYKGARNMETVKDCKFGSLTCVEEAVADRVGNFLGAMSDKVASGSDDGNFFVWDKATGKLDGIWEGDGSIVNGKLLSSLHVRE